MSSGVMFSGGVVWTSLVWLGGGWVEGACRGTSVEVLEVLEGFEWPQWTSRYPESAGPKPLKEEGAWGLEHPERPAGQPEPAGVVSGQMPPD